MWSVAFVNQYSNPFLWKIILISSQGAWTVNSFSWPVYQFFFFLRLGYRVSTISISHLSQHKNNKSFKVHRRSLNFFYVFQYFFDFLPNHTSLHTVIISASRIYTFIFSIQVYLSLIITILVRKFLWIWAEKCKLIIFSFNNIANFIFQLRKVQIF